MDNKCQCEECEIKRKIKLKRQERERERKKLYYERKKTQLKENYICKICNATVLNLPHSIIQHELTKRHRQLTELKESIDAQEDNIIKNIEQEDNIIKKTAQEDNIIKKTAQEDNIIKYTPQAGESIDTQADNIIKNTPQEGNIIKKTAQEDNIIKKPEQEGNIIKNTPQEGNIIKNTPQEGNIIKKTAQAENIIKDTPQEGNIIKKTAQADNIIKNTPREGNIIKDIYKDIYKTETLINGTKCRHIIKYTTPADNIIKGKPFKGYSKMKIEKSAENVLKNVFNTRDEDKQQKRPRKRITLLASHDTRKTLSKIPHKRNTILRIYHTPISKYELKEITKKSRVFTRTNDTIRIIKNDNGL